MRRTRGGTTIVVALCACALGWAVPEAGAAPPRLTVGDVRITEGDTGTRKVTFSISRNGSLGGNSSVRFATANGTAKAGSDYTAKTGRLSFASRQRKKTVTVAIRGDKSDEPNETFLLRLSKPSGARIADASAKATIVDNDPLVANAGPDQSVHVVDTVELNGSASRGGSLTYAWSFLARPIGSTAALTGATTATAEFDPDKPGTYVVRLIVSKGGKHSLADTVGVTATSQVVRFAALGAMGKGNQAQLDIAAAMAVKCAAAGCDYVVGLGNNIYDTGAASTSDPLFTTLFQTPYAGINLPFWMLLGNHDYGGGGTGNEPAKAQIQVDYTATQTKWKMPAHFYRRTDKHVEFFTLDTNSQMYGTDAAQETAVASWLASSTAYWKIALGLHSYRSNGDHGNAGAYEQLPFIPIANGAGVRDFMEDYVCGKADVSFSAFDHTLQWLQQDTTNCAGTELIVSGTGAATTAIEDPTRNPVHYQSATLGFAYVEIRDRSLTVEFIGVSGMTSTSLFTRTITR